MPDGNDEDRDLWRRLAAGRRATEPAACLDEAELAAFLAGRVDARERGRLEAHLAACTRCLAAAEEAVRIEQAPLAPVSDALIRRLRSAVAAEVGAGRGAPGEGPREPAGVAPRHSYLGPLPAWLALGAALLLTCRVGFALGGRAVADLARLREPPVTEVSFGLGESLTLEGEPQPFVLVSEP